MTEGQPIRVPATLCAQLALPYQNGILLVHFRRLRRDGTRLSAIDCPHLRHKDGIQPSRASMLLMVTSMAIVLAAFYILVRLGLDTDKHATSFGLCSVPCGSS